MRKNKKRSMQYQGTKHRLNEVAQSAKAANNQARWALSEVTRSIPHVTRDLEELRQDVEVNSRQLHRLQSTVSTLSYQQTDAEENILRVLEEHRLQMQRTAAEVGGVRSLNTLQWYLMIALVIFVVIAVGGA